MADQKSGKTRKRVAKKKLNHLFPAEEVTFAEASEAPKATDEELNSRYAKGDVRIVTESARYSLAGILAMLQETVALEGDKENGKTELRYKLDPEYQRRHRWNTVRKSRLIESFLMNVPVPPVFLYERDLARFEVMDGRQRLTALSEFYANDFALEGLEYWADLEGRTYAQLPSKIRDGIDRRYISSVILLKETAANDEQAAMLKKIVFERLNSGGVELSSQETRNAVYNGPLNQLCLRLSENPNFRRMWRIPHDPVENDENDEEVVDATDPSSPQGQKMFEKMEDVELVLRFFAYRQIASFKAGLNKISEFLDRFLMEGNKFSEEMLAKYQELFESNIDFLWKALGADAFCILSANFSRSRAPTKIVYDAIMFTSSAPDVKASWSSLLENKEVLRSELESMYENNMECFSGRKTNFKDAQQRNSCVQEAFFKAMEKTKKK